jgi:Txe/YoeB family toxin of Txe-Axe toxin-antitoxin module
MRIFIQKLSQDLEEYLIKHGLQKKWKKVKYYLEQDISHPSLNFEKIILEGKIYYSFRLDHKYRGICILEKDTIEIFFFTNHYK